jgi:hypothetical protein
LCGFGDVVSNVPEDQIDIDDKTSEAEKLIPVTWNKHEWYGIQCAARCGIDGQTLLPTITDSAHHMKLWFEEFPLDPRLQLFIPTSSFLMSVKFRPRDLAQVHTEVYPQGQADVVDINMVFQGSVAINLTKANGDDVLESIRQHMVNVSSTPGNEIKLKVCVEEENHADFLNSFQKSRQFDKLPWYPYLSKHSNSRRTHYGQLVKRANVQAIESEKIRKVPAANHFYDVDEAANKLYYGAQLEYERVSAS